MNYIKELNQQKMILTYNTDITQKTKKILENTSGISSYFSSFFSKKNDDVIVINNFHTEISNNLCDNELTKQAMNFASSSFENEWNKEDDDFWNNY